MTAEDNAHGLAFPTLEKSETWEANNGGYVTTHEAGGGLTKREFIAAVALQGLVAGVGWRPGFFIHPEEMAADARALADALLEELAK